MSIIDTVTSVTGWKWKLGAVAAMVSLVAVSGFLVYAQIENSHLVKVNADLDRRINDPKSGLLVAVAQCRTNTENAVGAIERQNAALVAKSKADAATLAEATRRLAIAQTESRKARLIADRLLSRKPQGSTLDAQVRDVDARLLETLK